MDVFSEERKENFLNGFNLRKESSLEGVFLGASTHTPMHGGAYVCLWPWLALETSGSIRTYGPCRPSPGPGSRDKGVPSGKPGRPQQISPACDLRCLALKMRAGMADV